MMAAVTFGVPDYMEADLAIDSRQAVSTASITTAPTTGEVFVSAIQALSVYLILFGVTLLVLLELKELHYLRKLLVRRRA
jgi:hypothetical protein